MIYTHKTKKNLQYPVALCAEYHGRIGCGEIYVPENAVEYAGDRYR